jgi:hypothetical protein
LKKIIAFVSFLAIITALSTSVSAAPSLVASFYGFQPNGTPYLYYCVGDDVGYDVRYDGNIVNSGDYIAGVPEGSPLDAWTREVATINGQSQLINTRYLMDTTDKTQYPADNKDMLLKITARGQNGPILFDVNSGLITLYMNPSASLKSPILDVAVTSIGYAHFHGPVRWSLTNDIHEKEELANRFNTGLQSNTQPSPSSWDSFEALFIAAIKNKSVDLSKETWLTVCGGTEGEYITPVFEQYQIICTTADNPLRKQTSLVPQTAEFDKRLLYQANVIFNMTDYTKKPRSFLVNGVTAPKHAVAYNDYMCTVSREYLSTMNTGETVLLTVLFNDGSEETVKIKIKDTTGDAFTQVFSDVTVGNTAWEFIQPLVRRGIIADNGGGQYGPDETVTYAEFYSMLAKTGVSVGDVSSKTAGIPAVEAENLLFNALTSGPFKAEYQALNKQYLWQPNAKSDLTVDDFAFLDMVLPHPLERLYGEKPDGTITFTRAQAAEVIYRFVQLIDFAKELVSIQQPTASPSPSKTFVDGKQIICDICIIGDYNYFKLRDLAFALNSTAKQFSVDYNAETGYITLTTNKPYTSARGELPPAGSKLRQASMTKVMISVVTDGKAAQHYLTAYNIGGYNYFKLRDLAKILDFGVGYDASTKNVTIATSAGYSE